MKFALKQRFRIRKNYGIRGTRNPLTVAVIPSINCGKNRSVTHESFSVPVEYIKEFCAETTIHGIRYFTEPKRHWLERVWWVIAVISSTILCALVTENVWINWRDHPVIVTFDEKTTPISKVPFPAVTICTTQKFVVDKVDMDIAAMVLQSNRHSVKYVDFSNLTLAEMNQVNALILVCGNTSLQKNPFTNQPQSESIYRVIREIAPSKEFVIPEAYINNGGILSYLHPMFTEYGLCYTFNSLNSREIYSDVVAPELFTVVDNPTSNWNTDDGYKQTANMSRIYPRNNPLVRDLWINLRILLDDFFKYYVRSPGCRICLHMPDERIDVRKCIPVTLGSHTKIDVDVNVMSTLENLRSYLPHVRGCYFEHERQLYYFKLYSRKKCEFECLTNLTRKELSCVHYYMPRDNGTPICTLAEHFSNHLEILYNGHHHDSILKQCDCLPDCNSINLKLEVATSTRHPYKSFSEYQKYLNVTAMEGINSSAFLFFKEAQFIAVIRSESSTMSDFIASCGGLLGLFMGFSMLTVVELTYYFTLRLGCKLRRTKKSC